MTNPVQDRFALKPVPMAEVAQFERELRRAHAGYLAALVARFWRARLAALAAPPPEPGRTPPGLSRSGTA